MRKLALAAAVSMSLANISSDTFALGMGEIEIFSALNQNLDAEIGLLSVQTGELAGATVRLAGEEAFSRAGLSLTPVLRTLRFEVEQRPDGEPIIKVFSDAPIAEPFLNFLVEIDSPAITPQMREYTLLLDPPVFVEQQNAVVADPVATLESIDVTDALEAIEVTDVAAADLATVGAEIDLSSVEPDTSADGPSVIFTEQGVVQFGSDVDNASTASVGEDIDLDADVGGEEIDLGTEILDTSELFVADEAAGEDIVLDGLADTGIFPTEEVFEDSTENVVDLSSLEATEVLVEDVAQAPAPAPTPEQIEGLDVSLDSLTPAVENFDIDLDSIEVEIDNTAVDVAQSDTTLDAIPEVTLEAIETIRVDGSREVVEPSVADAVITAVEPTLETDIDLSGLADADASLPVTDVAVDSADGESVDISGVVVVEEPQATPLTDSVVDTGVSTVYTVKAQDTLWSIARRSKPAGVSTPEMVQTIVAANPQAFASGNINSMREGARLTIPGGSAELSGSASQGSVAMVDVAQGDVVSGEEAPVTVVEDTLTATVTETAPVVVSGDVPLSSELDEVNKKMMLAQEELSSEAAQRNELSNRVGELEDSLTRMKDLITLRESELSNLQSEMSTESSATAVESTETSELTATTAGEAEAIPEKFKELEEKISENANLAQERVEAQADMDRNLASAEAEAKSLQLANEEDALKIQLAQLREEKLQLEQTAQQDKLELVQQAEAEKARLLENATAERDRILAQLEDEKKRITEEAAAERARIAAEAETEKERLLAEAQAERDRLAAESEQMRGQLEALEEEKNQLLAQSEKDKEQLAMVAKQAEEEQARLQAQAEAEKKKLEEDSSRAADKLAALQAEADANLANNNTDNTTIDRTDSDADGESSIVDIAAPAVVTTGLAAAPLERELGDRKTVLAAGGGLALLGLLGAWAARRKKVVPAAARRDERNDFDVDDTRGNQVATQYDHSRREQYDAQSEGRTNTNMGQAAVAASAAAAATGAAVVARGDRDDDQAVQVPDEPVAEPVAVEEPVAHPIIDEVLVDDTITEADVYLRYGLHGQAEDLLKASIEKSPDVEEYQVKLMESYHDQKNTTEFKAAAQKFKDRFGESANWPRIAEMGRNLDSSDNDFSRVGAMGAVAAGGAAAAAAVADEPQVPDVDISGGIADETIDAEAEFHMADLEATGDLTGVADTLPDDLDEISLDEVDMAALDDDGTLNLEEITGDQMSGLDLGTLDLTNPTGDSTLDNLTLDDAELNDLGDVTANVRSGLTADIDLDDGAISRTDEMETMLDLAKAYIDMGDSDSAAGALKDIVNNGSDAQKMEAQDLLRKLR